VLPPEQYAIVLDELGAVEQNVRLQVYPHHLESTAAVVEWTRGTTLTRFTKLLEPDLAGQFIDAFRTRVLEVLGDVSPYFYPFKRILMWAKR
jgi:trans-aconitate 2-methyltransferase